jgi:hypothetical protein
VGLEEHRRGGLGALHLLGESAQRGLDRAHAALARDLVDVGEAPERRAHAVLDRVPQRIDVAGQRPAENGVDRIRADHDLKDRVDHRILGPACGAERDGAAHAREDGLAAKLEQGRLEVRRVGREHGNAGDDLACAGERRMPAQHLGQRPPGVVVDVERRGRTQAGFAPAGEQAVLELPDLRAQAPALGRSKPAQDLARDASLAPVELGHRGAELLLAVTVRHGSPPQRNWAIASA